jgi:hypothetical protein
MTHQSRATHIHRYRFFYTRICLFYAAISSFFDHYTIRLFILFQSTALKSAFAKLMCIDSNQKKICIITE